MDNLTRGALDLAAAGYPVLPVGSKKTPSIRGGIHAATRNAATIREWSEAGLIKNVGVRTGSESELVVIDADTPEARERLETELGPPDVETKRGGHWYARHPKDGKLSSAPLGDGVDLKADGGYVLAPPSRDKSWTGAIPDPSDLPVLPDRLRPKQAAELPKRPRLSEDKLEAAVLAVYKHYPEEGNQYEFGRHLSGYLIRNGIAEEDAFEIQYSALSRTDGGADKEAEKNIGGVVTSTAKKLAEGEPVTGGPNVEEFAPGLPRELAGIFGWGPRTYELTDPGNAERFVDARGKDFRYVVENRAWYRWTGTRWAESSTRRVELALVDVVRRIYEEARNAPNTERQRELAAFARASQSKNRLTGVIQLVEGHLEVSVTDFDMDPGLLNVENGTIDLRTGELREHRREDLLTKIAPVQYDPDAKAPRFEKFIYEVLVSEGLVAFVQRFLGYSLTGYVDERALAVLHGPQGKNGKSTLVELFHDLLGDYASSTDPEILLQHKYSDSTGAYNLAELPGVRFVSASESDESRRLAEARIKQITGGDTITARAPYGKPFSYRPQFKLWFLTNNRPEVKGTDDAIWDRLRLIPFLQRFEGARQDKKLPIKLREELPGILAWAVRGCVAWSEHGLGSAPEVDEATQGYREEMDTFSQFIAERCVVDPDAEELASRLWRAWETWAEVAGEHIGSQTAFGNRLSSRGWVAGKGAKGVRVRRGVRLQPATPDPNSPNPPPSKSPPNTYIQVGRVAGLDNSGKLSIDSPSRRGVSEKRPKPATPPPTQKIEVSGMTIYYPGREKNDRT